ncbi:hypothetical protein [Prevotella melaninogenica]|nr:hypothetical protein [Prevotella melaninogenica]
MLRYYLSVDPELLPDEKWASTLSALKEIRKIEKESNNGQRT